MNIDDLHDAINLLDDDLIEEVDQLRNRKRKRSQRKTAWLCTATAACICVIVTCAYNAGRHSVKKYNMKNEKIIQEESFNDVLDMEKEKGASSNENLSLHVKIASWNEDGFTGVITDNMNDDTYSVGREVLVKTSTEIEDRKDFPAGSIVCISFDPDRTTEEETKTDDYREKMILYANAIQLADTK